MLIDEELARMAEQAADLIETNGWFRGVSTIEHQRFPTEPGNKCFCVVTATPYRNSDYFIRKFASYLGRKPSSRILPADFAIAWNDSQESADVVVRTLREFASTVRGHVVASR